MVFAACQDDTMIGIERRDERRETWTWAVKGVIGIETSVIEQVMRTTGARKSLAEGMHWTTNRMR